MRRGLWMALCAIGCAGGPAAVPRTSASVLPAIDITRLDGRAESARALVAGSVAVVDLWASWCTACVQERPKLERLYAAYADQGLRVIGLDVGEAPSVVSAYLSENRISYPIYLDPDFRMADALGEKRLPMILIVDRSGRIVHRSPTLDATVLERVKSELVSPP